MTSMVWLRIVTAAVLPGHMRSEFITKKNADGYPKIVTNNEKTIRIVEKLYDLYFETTGVYVTPNTTSPSGMA